MGYAEYDITTHATEKEADVRHLIARKTGLKDFTFQILKKSLDARKKLSIVWLFRVGVVSKEIPEGEKPVLPELEPQRKKRSKRVVIVGSGPAGFFSARYLAMCGFKVTVIERGSPVIARKTAIETFEKTGVFPKTDNYAFGEGGAGTFSDGKLSSRSKGINAERNWIFDAFVKAGAPEEINYMTHPHLGSDKLLPITISMRQELENLGCSFVFNSAVTDIVVSGDSVRAVKTGKGTVDGDIFVFATGHSAFETYRMLMSRGVPFGPKNFAVGFRAEHGQELINKSQWGRSSMPGVKAAEYRLAHQCADGTGVYTFCMCPGGKVVQASAFADANVVNGMSDFARAGTHANAAVVAGVNLGKLLGRETTASESLDWLENLERSFFAYAGGFRLPAVTIRDFIGGKYGSTLPKSSYPLGLMAADLARLMPPLVVAPIREGLIDFCKKINGYDTGVLMGLESKTSSPIQTIRHPEKLNSKYDNLYIAGEGSGWSGGIVSSAGDGLKIAQRISMDN